MRRAIVLAQPGVGTPRPRESRREIARRAVRSTSPAVRLLGVGRTATIPRMRALAVEAATAPAVAVIEDHVIVPPGWARRLLGALGDGRHVVGGAVDNAATGSVLNWAACLSKYSHRLPPLPAGRVDWLTGNNIVYRRELLGRSCGHPARRVGERATRRDTR